MTKYSADSSNIHPLKIASADLSLRHVFVRDLELPAQIGIHAHEKGKQQIIRINFDLAVTDNGLPTEDKLEEVVCYEALIAEVKDIIASGHVNLVETLAEAFAEASLKDPRVRSSRVRIEKIEAVPEAASVGIEIERHNIF